MKYGFIKSRDFHVLDEVLLLRDEGLAIECLEYCATEADDCRQVCGENSSCVIECGVKLDECIIYCPCQKECPNGCSGCESHFCQCKSGDEVPGLAECEEWDTFIILLKKKPNLIMCLTKAILHEHLLRVHFRLSTR